MVLLHLVPKQESCQLRGLRGVPTWAGKLPCGRACSSAMQGASPEHVGCGAHPQCCSSQLGQCLSCPVFRVDWWPCLARELVCSPTWSGAPSDELCWPLGQSCCFPTPQQYPTLLLSTGPCSDHPGRQQREPFYKIAYVSCMLNTKENLQWPHKRCDKEVKTQ